MQLVQCDREPEVLEALRSGRWASAWGEDLRQHVAGCAVCAEVLWVAQQFQHEAELARLELRQPDAGLPSAGLVWWKAQRAARRAAEARAAEPMVWVERAACALTALAGLGLGEWQWPRIAGWLDSIRSSMGSVELSSLPGDWLQRLAAAWPGQTPAFLLAASAVAFLAFLALAAYLICRED